MGAGRFHTAVSTGKALYTFGEDHGQLGELDSGVCSEAPSS